ncbi:MAG: divalent-cation tolerance protein CutA [Candidatus Diapherotrites archaeon]|nr:divalent-cation tolerance protein CutA [Candidatus Diapherotrites archaeon]
MDFVVVLVTCSTLKEARMIAKYAVEKKLAACVNITKCDSIFSWKDEINETAEYVLFMKTRAERLQELEKEVKRLHSYDVPEFIALPIIHCSKDYLGWVTTQTG